ncbi:uncharacterized protein [Struthio camelus]|uniref:uncharacterized protein n=1 Tax=Struthio camelus TaxID=8801 RepID=UPI0036042F2B
MHENPSLAMSSIFSVLPRAGKEEAERRVLSGPVNLQKSICWTLSGEADMQNPCKCECQDWVRPQMGENLILVLTIGQWEELKLLIQQLHFEQQMQQ